MLIVNINLLSIAIPYRSFQQKKFFSFELIEKGGYKFNVRNKERDLLTERKK